LLALLHPGGGRLHLDALHRPVGEVRRRFGPRQVVEHLPGPLQGLGLAARVLIDVEASLDLLGLGLVQFAVEVGDEVLDLLRLRLALLATVAHGWLTRGTGFPACRLLVGQAFEPVIFLPRWGACGLPPHDRLESLSYSSVSSSASPGVGPGSMPR